MTDEAKTVAEQHAQAAAAEVAAVRKDSPVEAFEKAIAAVDLKALRAVEGQLSKLTQAHAAVQRFVAAGHKVSAAHNAAFEKARTLLHQAHGGAAGALDAYEAFGTLLGQAKDLFVAAEKAKAEEQGS